MNDLTATASDGRPCPSENPTEATPHAESRGAQTIALQAWLIEQYPTTFNPDAPPPPEQPELPQTAVSGRPILKLKKPGTVVAAVVVTRRAKP